MTNLASRIITGTVMVLIGIVLIMISIFSIWIPLIYGIPILIIGLFILFNKREDEIESLKK